MDKQTEVSTAAGAVSGAYFAVLSGASLIGADVGAKAGILMGPLGIAAGAAVGAGLGMLVGAVLPRPAPKPVSAAPFQYNQVEFPLSEKEEEDEEESSCQDHPNDEKGRDQQMEDDAEREDEESDQESDAEISEESLDEATELVNQLRNLLNDIRKARNSTEFRGLFQRLMTTVVDLIKLGAKFVITRDGSLQVHLGGDFLIALEVDSTMQTTFSKWITRRRVASAELPSNVIYGIRDVRCNSDRYVYVGKTKNKLNVRGNEHRSVILKFTQRHPERATRKPMVLHIKNCHGSEDIDDVLQVDILYEVPEDAKITQVELFFMWLFGTLTDGYSEGYNVRKS